MSDALGILGGTFDPVHFGHLRLAEEARMRLALERVRWIPAGDPRHRPAPRVSASHRLAMVRLATTGHEGFEVDAADVESAAASYTVPTLERLRGELGSTRPLVLILGADAFAGLPTWHRWRELLEFAHLAIACRPGYALDARAWSPELAACHRAATTDDPATLAHRPAGAIVEFAMTPLDISATAIRASLQRGERPRYLLPDAVIDYIAAHNLYCQN